MSALSEHLRPNYPGARALATELLAEFGIDQPPVNPVQIAKGRGVDVKFVTLTGEYRERVSGFFDARENRIYVNSDEYALRQTFTIAHELYHALAHREWALSGEYKVLLRAQFNNNFNDPKEKEANHFAAHLLVPRAMLDRFYATLTVSDMSQIFAVSVSVIKNRLESEYGIRA